MNRIDAVHFFHDLSRGESLRLVRRPAYRPANARWTVQIRYRDSDWHDYSHHPSAVSAMDSARRYLAKREEDLS